MCRFGDEVFTKKAKQKNGLLSPTVKAKSNKLSAFFQPNYRELFNKEHCPTANS
ncbi:hypothetical protein MITS9509_02108 [Synechococcus sp. MIT S9509]|nr:hypothetical protein MITS9509_02108 [Synechococcus sp. MIT S9509]